MVNKDRTMGSTHTKWADTIRGRNEELMAENDANNWYPFTKNIEDMIQRIKEMEAFLDDFDNRLSEVIGNVKGLYKSLNKLGFMDKEFKLNWPVVKKLEEWINEEETDGE